MSAGAAVAIVGGAVLAGVYVLAVLDALAGAVVAGRPARTAAVDPFRRAAFLLAQQANVTEKPDEPAWRVAPPLLLALAAGGLALVPTSASTVPVDAPAGIVVWGAVEALVVVAVFLHGWSANALLPLLGAYRYVALALSILLVSMFVLIAAALPAESLRLAAVVESQEGLWNVVRQPLGLPLFLIVAMGLTFWGPLDLADSADLASGTAAEASGAPLLVWRVARGAIRVSFAAMAATVFLGGWLGPWLPGPLWLALKTLSLLALLVAVRHLVPRIGTERLVASVWTVLLPISFAHLAWAGLEALR